MTIDYTQETLLRLSWTIHFSLKSQKVDKIKGDFIITEDIIINIKLGSI